MEIYQLDPVSDFVNYECSTDIAIFDLYVKINRSLSPLIIYLLEGADYCFSEELIVRRYKEEHYLGYQEGDKIRLYCGTEYRFVVFTIILLIKGDKLEGHSQIILVDNLERSIQFFDPNGLNLMTIKEAKWFRDKFKQLLPEYKFRLDEEYCPIVGPQKKAPLPFCGAFSVLYLLLVVLNPQIPSNEILKMILALTKDELTDLIYKLVCFMYDVIIEQGIDELTKDYITLYNKILTNEPKSNERARKLRRITRHHSLCDKQYFKMALKAMERKYG